MAGFFLNTTLEHDCAQEFRSIEFWAKILEFLPKILEFWGFFLVFWLKMS